MAKSTRISDRILRKRQKEFEAAMTVEQREEYARLPAEEKHKRFVEFLDPTANERRALAKRIVAAIKGTTEDKGE